MFHPFNCFTKNALTGLVLLGLGTFVQAAAVNISVSTNANGAPAKFVSSTGSNLNTGSAVRVGYFSFGGSPNLAEQAVLTSSSFAAIDALFTPLGDENATFGSGTGTVTVNNAGFLNLPGHVVAGLTNVNQTDAGHPDPFVPVGTQLYLWVFNNSNPASASEWSLFTASAGWAVPAAGSEALASAEITLAYQPGAVVQGAALRDGSGNFRLAAIPEPTTGLLLIGSTLVYFLRRRVNR